MKKIILILIIIEFFIASIDIPYQGLNRRAIINVNSHI